MSAAAEKRFDAWRSAVLSQSTRSQAVQPMESNVHAGGFKQKTLLLKVKVSAKAKISVHLIIQR